MVPEQHHRGEAKSAPLRAPPWPRRLPLIARAGADPTRASPRGWEQVRRGRGDELLRISLGFRGQSAAVRADGQSRAREWREPPRIRPGNRTQTGEVQAAAAVEITATRAAAPTPFPSVMLFEQPRAATAIAGAPVPPRARGRASAPAREREPLRMRPGNRAQGEEVRAAAAAGATGRASSGTDSLPLGDAVQPPATRRVTRNRGRALSQARAPRGARACAGPGAAGARRGRRASAPCAATRRAARAAVAPPPPGAGAR